MHAPGRPLIGCVVLSLFVIALLPAAAVSAGADVYQDAQDTPDGIDVETISHTVTEDGLALAVTTYQPFLDERAAFRWGFSTGPGDYDGFSVQVRWSAQAGALTGQVDDWHGEHLATPTFSRPTPDSLVVTVPAAATGPLDGFTYEMWTWIDLSGEGGMDEGEPVDNAVARTNPVFRIAGADRYETAIAASQAGFEPGSAAAVVLVNADRFADAVVATPLATSYWAPVLFTQADVLPAYVEAEVQRTLPAGETVFLVGGPTAIGAGIEARLVELGYAVVRLGGADRFETSVKVAEALGFPSTVLFATGTDFADGIAAGVAASSFWEGAAVLLTDGAVVPPAVGAYLADHAPETLYAVGGPAATAMPAATAIAGRDRYETTAMIAAQFTSEWGLHRVLIASGTKYPDATIASTVSGRTGNPLLLTAPEALSAPAASFMRDNAEALTSGTVFGGTGAVSEAVRASAKTAL